MASLFQTTAGGARRVADRLSNHLPEVVEAIGGKIPVLIDSGFRRGTDIFKALALGAKGVCIGRPYLWGLAAFGQPGVERALELLTKELEMAMRMNGAPTISSITRRFVTGEPEMAREACLALAQQRITTWKPRPSYGVRRLDA